MRKINKIASHALWLPMNDIDTDQIIPARFLKTTDKTGLGSKLFSDWRYERDGTPKPEFPINQTAAQGARILVAGDNFGCGSSREHAPWALTAWGIEAVISTSFADIFRSNALKNGLLPIEVSSDVNAQIISCLQNDAQATFHVELEGQTLTLPDGIQVTFPIDSFAKHCLLQGIDELSYLLSLEPHIQAYEAKQV
jgi:3-isopropylmalate/(R)-2-methylmalate dehydratase small subunit